VLSRVKSTEKDNDRTSGLKSEFLLGSGVRKPHNCGYVPGFANTPFASRAANAGSRLTVTSGNLELSSGAGRPSHAFAPKRPALFGGRIRLHQETFSRQSHRYRHVPERGLRSASLPVTPNHLVKEQHGMSPSPNSSSLEMNLTAVMLGRKQ